MNQSETNAIEELEEKLEEIEETVRENHEMTHQILKIQKLNLALRVFYWILVLGGVIGASIYAAPYVDEIKSFIGL
jgi:Mg2+ and Co2+ transporter CorA